MFIVEIIIGRLILNDKLLHMFVKYGTFCLVHIICAYSNSYRVFCMGALKEKKLEGHKRER